MNDLTKITVQTLPNGYSLNIGETEKHMYFNEVDLLAGFMAHVGAGETKDLEKGSVMSAVMSVMMGEAYADAVSTLKQRVGLLTIQYNNIIEQMDKSVDYANQAEKTIIGMLQRIATVEDALKGTEKDYNTTKREASALNMQLQNIQQRMEQVDASLTNLSANMKMVSDAFTEHKSKKKKPADNETDDRASNSKDGEEKPKGGAKKGGRAKADAMVQKIADQQAAEQASEAAEIEQRAQDNPNIK